MEQAQSECLLQSSPVLLASKCLVQLSTISVQSKANDQRRREVIPRSRLTHVSVPITASENVLLHFAIRNTASRPTDSRHRSARFSLSRRFFLKSWRFVDELYNGELVATNFGEMRRDMLRFPGGWDFGVDIDQHWIDDAERRSSIETRMAIG